MGKKVTMQDIADALQVSVVTVSNALSNKEGVGKELRYKIRETAIAMGYPYHPDGKPRKKKISYTAGVIMAECFCSDNAFYSLLYEKLLLEFEKVNYSCILEVISHEDEIRGVLPHMILENKVDGIVVLGQIRRSYIDMLVIEDVPYIFLDFYDEHYSVDSIVSDSVCGSYLLTNHLIENGYRKIGYIGNLKATSSILDRYLGYYKALFQSGIKPRQDWIISDRDQDGNFVLPLTLPKELPEAFVCNCDAIAFFLMEQLKEAGYRIPEDIAIVGYDDSAFAQMCSPQLTTFRINQEMMVEAAVDVFIKRLRYENYYGGRTVVGGRVVIRDSVRLCEKK